MILRPRLIVQATCATWVAVMGGCLYASAIWSSYESFSVASERDRGNGVNQWLDGGAIESPASLSGGQEPPSLPGNPVRHNGRKGEATSPAPGFERESPTPYRVTRSPRPARDGGGVAASYTPRVALSRGVRYEPGSGSPSSLGLTESRAGALRYMATNAANLCVVPVDLFHRQIARESGWNPRARSSSGALGLGQLMPAAAREMGVTDRLDPWQNAVGSACYLRRQFDRFGSWRKALHAYHGGPNRIRTSQAGRDYAADIMGSAQ